MKKTLTALAIASIASIQFAQADIAGFEVGTYQWTPDYKGTLSSDGNATAGSTIDIQEDLGFSDESHNVLWFSLEHPVPVIPNVKIVSSSLKASTYNQDLNRDVIFAGQLFLNVPNSDVDEIDTTFDMSNTEYTFYYEILDNWINIDLGVTIREYDGHVTLSTDTRSSTDNLDFTIPLFYAAARADLPFTGFFVDGQINLISAGGNSLSDTMIGLGYESDIGLGAKAGYRKFSMDVDEKGFVSDLEFDGAYISVFYHF